jgi:hypothetical protein
MKGNEQIIRTTIRVPQWLWDKARHRAIDEKLSLQDLVIKALVKYVGGKENKWPHSSREWSGNGGKAAFINAQAVRSFG